MKDDSFDCTLIAHLRIFLLFYRLLYCLILPENRLFFGIWKVVEIETEQRLIEQNYGIYENTDWDGEAFNANKREFAVRYPGGESMLDLAGRLYPLLNKLKAENGPTTLLVCHGGICRMIRTYFLDVKNTDYAAFKLSNCGIMEFDL